MSHAFSIENKINAATGLPFGPKFAGTFKIRRPTIGDKRAIALKDAASQNAYGRVDADQVGEGLKLLTYIAIFVQHVAEEKLPEWFDLHKLYDETDESAVLAVWEEVRAYLDTFRPAHTGSASAGAAPGTASVVSAQV